MSRGHSPLLPCVGDTEAGTRIVSSPGENSRLALVPCLTGAGQGRGRLPFPVFQIRFIISIDHVQQLVIPD